MKSLHLLADGSPDSVANVLDLSPMAPPRLDRQAFWTAKATRAGEGSFRAGQIVGLKHILTCGKVWSSKFLAYGVGTSAPAIRSKGWQSHARM